MRITMMKYFAGMHTTDRTWGNKNSNADHVPSMIPIIRSAMRCLYFSACKKDVTSL